MTVDEDGYEGRAALIAGAEVVPVSVTLTGRFDPIEGRYRWYGRVTADERVTALLEAGTRGVVLSTPFAEVAATLGDVDPWGRVRVGGVGTAPFEVVRSLPEELR